MATVKKGKAIKESAVATKPSITKSVARVDEMDKLKANLELRRKHKQQEEPEFAPPRPSPVSLGPVGAIVDALINTAPEKMLELTDFDRNQVALIPQVIVVDDMWDYLEQVTLFRSDSNYYAKVHKKKFPETPDTTGKFVLLLARCRRSLGGKTQKALEDLALADLETRANDEGMGNLDDFKD